jgi:sec-independent protein translocase protein TatA
MPFGIGPLEIVIVLAVVLLVFGGRKLPEMGRGLGKGMREFKQGISGEERTEPVAAIEPAPVEAAPARETVGDRAA